MVSNTGIAADGVGRPGLRIKEKIIATIATVFYLRFDCHCKEIAMNEQGYYLPPTVQKAWDAYVEAVDAAEKLGDAYLAIREDKRTEEQFKEWLDAQMKCGPAWREYQHLYNNWKLYPDEYEPVQETIELRNL